MYLAPKEYQKVLAVIEKLGGSLDSKECRRSAGYQILDLLNADHFASYIWSDQQQQFQDCVSINMTPDNLKDYEEYYQFHDPITRKLERQRYPTLVNQVISQNNLLKTEFYNDFLARDGLYYGINLFVHDGQQSIGDLRIWRTQGKENFNKHSVQVLELLRPHFANVMRSIKEINANKSAKTIEREPANNTLFTVTKQQLMEQFKLTKREAQVAIEIFHGKTDAEIANTLHIAFTTLRTHIKHIFYKVSVNSRSSLIYKITNAYI